MYTPRGTIKICILLLQIGRLRPCNWWMDGNRIVCYWICVNIYRRLECKKVFYLCGHSKALIFLALNQNNPKPACGGAQNKFTLRSPFGCNKKTHPSTGLSFERNWQFDGRNPRMTSTSCSADDHKNNFFFEAIPKCQKENVRVVLPPSYPNIRWQSCFPQHKTLPSGKY